MKVTELITKLEEAKKEYGDLEVEMSVDVEGSALKAIDEVALDNVGNIFVIYPK